MYVSIHTPTKGVTYLDLLHLRSHFVSIHRNTTFEPMRISAENYGDDYMAFDSSSVESFYEDEVKPLLDDINSLEDLEKFVSARKELLDEIKSIDETQLVIACHGHYYETIDKETMEWSFDSNTYVIGVIKD